MSEHPLPTEEPPLFEPSEPSEPSEERPDALRVLNPATEEVVATVPAASAADVDAAVVRAARAQTAWAALGPGDRARLLRRFAAVVDEHVEELARLEVREAGHLVGNARWEAGNVRDLLDYAAGGVERLTGRQIPVAGGLDVTLLEPLGVVGVIAPWNFPMPIAAWATAPALAAGNAVLLKPAETTPLTALRLAELALAAGLPEGLFQVLPGPGPVTGDALVGHPGVAKIVFTGSTAVGRRGGADPSPSNSAARAPTSSSPTPTWRPPRPPRPCPSSTTAARTAAPAPGSSSSAPCTTASSPCSPPRSRPSASATRPTRAPAWAR